ncbi:MAG TPA: Hpt domain-containing protein [Polyangiaceae bacterium]
MSSSSDSTAGRSTRRRVFVPLGTRLTVPVVLLVAAVAVGAYFGVERASRKTAMQSKEVAADMVTKLTSLSVMPAVVFGDEIEIRRAVDDLARNPEVIDVEVWSIDAIEKKTAATPLASFHRAGGRPLGLPGAAKSARARDTDSVSAVEPIVGPDGKTVGALSVRFSTAREAAALAQISRQILIVSLATAVCLAGAILIVMGRMVVSPIRRLERAAKRLARGGASEPPEALVAPGIIEDEVGRLATVFGDMADAVRDREHRLAVKNDELRLILDSVDQGFLTARPDGTFLAERSAILSTWLGRLPNELTLWELCERIDPASRGWAEMAWLQFVDGMMPAVVAIAQLPKNLVGRGRHFELTYHPVMNGESLDRVVIVLTDVTAEIERQRAVAEQHEFSVLVDQFVRDRRAFLDFWREASNLVRRVVQDPKGPTSEALRRDVHTLKGNARFFGLTRISTLCHSLEDAMRERGENMLTAQERATLADAWEALRRRIDPIIEGATAFLQVSEEEYRRLLEAIDRRLPLPAIEDLVRGLRLEPTAWRLGRAREMLATACQKLGKTAPKIVIEHNDLRLSPGRWSPFWSVLPHVLNNAADHGIESDDQRRNLGKTLPANVRLSTTLKNGEFLIEVRDDGPGIDWDEVRRHAEKREIPVATQADLERALVSEGFSLKQAVSDVSGRGVGLAAVQSVVAAMRGRIEIQSEKGRGTTWLFRFPQGKLLDAEEKNPDPTAWTDQTTEPLTH